jgi:hypothetical protein
VSSNETVATPADSPAIPLPQELTAEAVVLPREIDDDGLALYDDSVLTFVKEFHETDATANFAHDSASRGWIGEKAVKELAINLIVGIASSGGWDALCYVFRHRYAKAPVRVKAGRFRQTDDEVTWEWYEAEGTGADVAAALAAIPWSDGSEVRVEQEEETEPQE